MVDMENEESFDPISRENTIKLLKLLKKGDIEPLYDFMSDLIDDDDVEISMEENEMSLGVNSDNFEKLSFPLTEEKKPFDHIDIVLSLLKLSTDYVRMKGNETLQSILLMSEEELTNEIKENLIQITSQILQKKKIASFLSNVLHNKLPQLEEIDAQVNIRTLNLKMGENYELMFFPEGLLTLTYYDPLREKTKEIPLNLSKKQLKELKEKIDSLIEDIDTYQTFLEKKIKNESK